MIATELFWQIFKETGSISAYLLYRNLKLKETSNE
ncbi:MAG: YqzL family protein [Chloroflexi bacterium]|nr:YqzL family protein [Chloroflexota bacterium]